MLIDKYVDIIIKFPGHNQFDAILHQASEYGWSVYEAYEEKHLAIKEQHKKLLCEFFELQIECLVPSAERAVKAISLITKLGKQTITNADFANNFALLTFVERARLDQIVKAVSDCGVTVTVEDMSQPAKLQPISTVAFRKYTPPIECPSSARDFINGWDYNNGKSLRHNIPIDRLVQDAHFYRNWASLKLGELRG